MAASDVDELPILVTQSNLLYIEISQKYGTIIQLSDLKNQI